MKYALLVLLTFFSLNSLFAEDINLDRIVITPSRTEEDYVNTGRKVDVISAKEIERSGSNDIAELLGEHASVNISNYGGLGASKNIRMRGSTASQVLVLIDSRPVNNPRDGEVDFSGIPLDNIDRIEIMHGPASSIYGSQAMGGVVNIVTKRPPKDKFKTSFLSSFGTFRTYNEELSHGGNIYGLGYLFTGQYRSSEGSRANSEFDSRDFNTKLEYAANANNNIKVNFGFYKSKLGTPGPESSIDTDDKQRNIKNFLDLGWDFDPDDKTMFKARVYNNYDRLEFNENSAGSIFDIQDSKAIHTTQSRGIDVQLNRDITEKIMALCGLNYIKNMNDSTASGKHKYNVKAMYAQVGVDLIDKLKLNLSARLDDYSNFGTEFNPSVNLLYKIGDKHALHFLASRSFRAPTFNDLYWPDEGWAKGNPNLKPEKGVTVEFGAETKPFENIGLGITYYRNIYDELINWTEEAGVWQPQNVGSSRMDGIEFENKIKLPKNFETDIAYTYLRAKDEKTHKYLIYQPQHKADLSFKYKGFSGCLLELRGQFTSTRYHDSENSIKVKRFFTVGARLSKRFNKTITYFMSIENMLNRKYQVIRDYPMPGFSIDGGFKVDF